jgi:hypothetical protein
VGIASLVISALLLVCVSGVPCKRLLRDPLAESEESRAKFLADMAHIGMGGGLEESCDHQVKQQGV